MNGGERNNITLESIATILGSTFLLNLTLLFLWFFPVLFAPDWMYRMNVRWFAISRHEFDLVNYVGIAFLKIINIVFFLFPYLSIKLLLRRKKGQG